MSNKSEGFGQILLLTCRFFIKKLSQSFQDRFV
nr:MAG TPA: hypothetical protein [Caudoviricetes sp.]